MRSGQGYFYNFSSRTVVVVYPTIAFLNRIEILRILNDIWISLWLWANRLDLDRKRSRRRSARRLFRLIFKSTRLNCEKGMHSGMIHEILNTIIPEHRGLVQKQKNVVQTTKIQYRRIDTFSVVFRTFLLFQHNTTLFWYICVLILLFES